MLMIPRIFLAAYILCPSEREFHSPYRSLSLGLIKMAVNVGSARSTNLYPYGGLMRKPLRHDLMNRICRTGFQYRTTA